MTYKNEKKHSILCTVYYKMNYIHESYNDILSCIMLDCIKEVFYLFEASINLSCLYLIVVHYLPLTHILSI